MYRIINDIWLWFSVFPFIHALNCHSLCAALSSNVGAWGMWACSLYRGETLQISMFHNVCQSFWQWKPQWQHIYRYIYIYDLSILIINCHTHCLHAPQRPWNSVWIGLLVFYPRLHVFVAEKLDADERQEEAFTVPDRLQEAEVLDP